MSLQEHNTKEKILLAVIHLLAEGQSQLSMAHIAVETGISKSALYHFFANKKDLFQQVIIFIFEELIQEIELIAAQSLEPREKMRQMMEACTNCAQRDSTVTHFIFQQVFENDEQILKKIHSMREHLKSFFADTLEEGMKIGIFRQTDIAKSAEIVVGFIDFIALKSALPCPIEDNNLSADSLCVHLLNLLLNK